MISLRGYKVHSVLYEGMQSNIYCGYRELDGQKVVLKLLRSDAPSAEERARFQQEYELTSRLSSDAVIVVFGLETHSGSHVMVLEDFGGTALSMLDIAGQLDLKDWLRLAMKITDCIGTLHQHHVMHKDINPSNILWNRETDQVKIIDLGISTELSREVTEIRNPNKLEGTLFYMSPEQTGRMNRAIDYRTDFYSLGVTLYELLTGKLPFPKGDALELVHAHIAKQHTPVSQINTSIPSVISAIIDKLMAKTAEARYQSAAGLKADLQTCLNNVDAQGNISEFELCQSDYSLKLQITQKLYGREAQITKLMQFFEKARTGSAELLLVKGYSGIGKSALVHEVKKPITEHRGYFIEGRSDQFKKGIPYAAFTQALQELIDQILTEDNDRLQEWKSKIHQVLGDNAQVMVDLLPHLAWLIGPQPAIPELPPAQAQNRFNQEFKKFVGLFASAEHPLVIFLDDLQWADLPSLQLISLLLRSPATPHLLLIGAYRDNEVTETHALTMMLTEMGKQGPITQSIVLSPLHLGDIERLLQDTLQCTASRVEDLAQLCLAKTQGNPFFLNQFLKVLVEKQMLFRDAVGGEWNWNAASIGETTITDNIVSRLVGKLQTLKPETQRVLQGAACLGNIFDLKTLAVVCEMPETEAAKVLWPALEEEMLIPLDNNYKYAKQAGHDAKLGLIAHFRFQHDRVQQAAYQLSEESKRTSVHLAIGRLWSKSLTSEEMQVRLLDVVNHLNIGKSLITDQDERWQLAHFNLKAAMRAKTSAAYKPALTYAQTAIELVDEADWQTHYEFMLALYLEAAEDAYLSVAQVEMEKYIEAALRHTRDSLDTAKAIEIRMQAFISQNRFKDAVITGLEVLEVLGITFPKHISKYKVIFSLLKTKWAMRGKSVEELASLPEMTDPRILAAMRILIKVTRASHYGMPKYLSLFTLKAIYLAVKYGRAPISGFNFAAFGVTMTGVLNDVEKGARFGKLALNLLENSNQIKHRADSMRAATLQVVHGMIQPWTVPLKKTLDGLKQSYLYAMEDGDLEFVANAAVVYTWHLFYSGNDLMLSEKEAAAFIPVIEQAQRPSMLNAQKLTWQCMRNLMGNSPEPAELKGDVCTDVVIQEVESDADDENVKFILSLNRLILLYTFGRFREARRKALARPKLSNTIAGFYGRSLLLFYDALTNLEIMREVSQEERSQLLKDVIGYQKKLKFWANYAPDNFLNKWHLVEARLAQYRNTPIQAIDHFEEAIQLASQNGILQDEALAYELTGKFYELEGKVSLAQIYLEKAQQAYGRWGAIAKVKDLANRYPQWLRERGETVSNIGNQMIVTSGALTSATSGGNGMLDLFAVMKASHALSQEIVLARLLKRLISVAIETAAAQRGVLLLKKNSRWLIEAEQGDGDVEATVLQSVEFKDQSQEALQLPLSVVQYVIRSGQSLVIPEATQDNLFGNDLFIQALGVRSLLCMPIMHQGEMTGILYLENNAASGIFTEGRLEVLRLLATQAAISIENARLYADMEERVAARTAEIKAISLRDGLTGVANRKAFDERIKEEFARVQRNGQVLSLLFIDIDHFKNVNDRYGHPVGDECLRKMGKVLTSVNRRASDFVARYGGEEFAYVLSDTDMEGARLFADRVLNAVRTIVLEIGEIRHSITASIGVATCTRGEMAAPELLITKADRCLYIAKESGRNRIVHIDHQK